MVVQPGQHWDRDNGAGSLDCPTGGRVFAKPQVRAHLIVVGRIRRKNLPQVRLTEDQHPVQALATHGANQTLHIRILPRRSKRDRSVAVATKPMTLMALTGAKVGAINVGSLRQSGLAIRQL